LRVKLRHLPEWQRARQEHAEAYSKRLLGIPGIAPPLIPEHYEHVFHQYTIRVERRDALQKALHERQIGSAVYYPVPLHLQPLYAPLGYKPGDFPHAEHAAKEVISLPMYPELRPEQIARVADAVAEFVTAEEHRSAPRNARSS
jgi:dTDP-4-amino-4,6-dideoxygalactose transaminase